MKNLYKLVQELKDANERSLSDETLKERGCSTREEIGIGEYSYGIIMCPIDWILPFLEELIELRKYKSYCDYPDNMGR